MAYLTVSKLANRQMNKSMDKTNRQTDKQTNRQTNRQTDRQTDKQTDKQTNRQADRQTDRHTYRQTDKQTDRQIDRQTDSRQTGEIQILRLLILLFFPSVARCLVLNLVRISPAKCLAPLSAFFAIFGKFTIPISFRLISSLACVFINVLSARTGF